MGKIIISENVTLDGVIQDPAGDEGFRHGGWFGKVGDKDREEAARVLLDETLGTKAMLLGRRSYEFLAARWPSSPTSPTSPSETRSRRCLRVGRRRVLEGSPALGRGALHHAVCDTRSEDTGCWCPTRASSRPRFLPGPVRRDRS
jgi:hypothetical protein